MADAVLNQESDCKEPYIPWCSLDVRAISEFESGVHLWPLDGSALSEYKDPGVPEWPLSGRPL